MSSKEMRRAGILAREKSTELSNPMRIDRYYENTRVGMHGLLI